MPFYKIPCRERCVKSHTYMYTVFLEMAVWTKHFCPELCEGDYHLKAFSVINICLLTSVL